MTYLASSNMIKRIVHTGTNSDFEYLLPGTVPPAPPGPPKPGRPPVFPRSWPRSPLCAAAKAGTIPPPPPLFGAEMRRKIERPNSPIHAQVNSADFFILNSTSD